jgi:hypothetical protein
MRTAGTRRSVRREPSLKASQGLSCIPFGTRQCVKDPALATKRKQWLIVPLGIQFLMLWNLHTHTGWSAAHAPMPSVHVPSHPAGYLDACGGGLHLQIGRTVSIDKTLGKASLHRDGSASFMLESDSLQDEVWACCTPT